MKTTQHNTESPLGTTTPLAHNGRKGPSYDWQSLLVPAEPVFEASLQMLLADESAHTTSSRPARRRS